MYFHSKVVLQHVSNLQFLTTKAQISNEGFFFKTPPKAHQCCLPERIA